MPTIIEQLGAKIYLIYTHLMPRPFLTTVPFIASDFASWGYRVDQHASDSPYIAEIQAREKLEHKKRNGRDASQRAKLMDLWAREIIEKKRTEREARRRNSAREESERANLPAETACEYPLVRLQRTGHFVHDFFNAVAEADDGDITSTRQPSTSSPEELRVCEHVRHLYAVRYAPNAALPDWSHPSINYADMIVLEYHPSKTFGHDDFLRALGKAIGKNEKRMGKVETCSGTGAAKVFLFVDVGDVVDTSRHGSGDVEDWDPVPQYERGERPPAYV